jgi:arylsulfatase A-like enzyme
MAILSLSSLFSLSLLFLILFLSFFSYSSSKLMPNIIILLLDDAGWGDLSISPSLTSFSSSTSTSLSSNTHISSTLSPFSFRCVATPSIDSIAQNGVTFHSGYVTAPQCSPSRVSLLTGRYQQHYGHETNTEYLAALSQKKTLIIPQYLPKEYYSGIFGKWNLGDIPNSPLRHGFHESHLYRDYDQMFSLNQTVQFGNSYVSGREYSTSLLFRSANEFITNQTSQNRPFFLYLSPMSPHVPHVFPPSFSPTFNGFPDSLPLSRRKVFTMLTEIDQNVGKLLTLLKKLEIYENTLFFFLNDNGSPPLPKREIERTKERNNASLLSECSESPNFPLKGFKGDLHEGGIRVKYLLQWPSVISPNQHIKTPVSSLDILPTVLHLFEHSTSALDGVTLFPLLRWKSSKENALRIFHHSPSRRLFWRFLMVCKPEKRAMMSGDMKWIEIRNELNPVVELYNISFDSNEKINLSSQLPDIVQRMEREYAQWEKQFPPILGRSENKIPCPNL